MAGNYAFWQERFNDWEAKGVKIVPVLSKPDSQWTGERGYVQVLVSSDSWVVSSSLCFLVLIVFVLDFVECFLKDEEYCKRFIGGSNFVWT